MPHIHEAIDNTVAAYIVHEGKVLLVNHLQLKKWLPVGGHIELDQDPNEALFAEVEQETGLTAENVEIIGERPPDLDSTDTKFLYPPAYMDIHEISQTHRHIGNVYFLRAKIDIVKLAEEEHADIRWFDANDLNDPVYDLNPGVKFYAQQALIRACQ